MASPAPHYLGIDAGTQGLSVVLTDADLRVLGTGDGHYDLVEGLDEGCYEQRPEDWLAALRQAMDDLRTRVDLSDKRVAAIGVAGQMHGEVIVDAAGEAISTARLWCDARNAEEGDELTAMFGAKAPKRMTAARWLWTTRNRPEVAAQAAHLTTPAGWIAHNLTGDWELGVGEASGMFPIDQATLDYDKQLAAKFDTLTADGLPPILDLLPTVRCAGQSPTVLSAAGAELLGVAAGAPVAAAEGDQPAGLAGSLIAEPGLVSAAFGTSVCANAVGDRPFQGVSPAVDHFCAVDGKPINMVCLTNGTTFLNAIVRLLTETHVAAGGDAGDAFAAVMRLVVDAPNDAAISALPLLDDEPGVGALRGGLGTITGLSTENATAGSVARAALLATMFNFRHGCDVLDEQGCPRTELILTGGLAKTPELGQLLADAMRTPVTVPDAADEGVAWGAALLAKHQHAVGEAGAGAPAWSDFVASHRTSGGRHFEPDEAAATALDAAYERHKRLLAARPTLESAVLGDA